MVTSNINEVTKFAGPNKWCACLSDEEEKRIPMVLWHMNYQ